MNFFHLLKVNVAGKIINHLLVFFINVIIVRIMGVERSGSYFNELYILNVFSFLLSFGLDFASIAWIHKNPSYYSILHRLFFRLSLAGAIGCWVVAYWLLPLIKIYPIQDALTMTLFCFGQLGLILFQGLLSAKKKFNTQNRILIFSNTAFIILLFVAQSNHHDTSSMIRMYAGLMSCQAILLMLVSYQPINTLIESVSISPLFTYGFKIMLSSLIYFVFLRADNFFVGYYTDAKTLGNYVQCGKVGQYFIYFSSVISSTLIPFIASEQLATSYQGWKKLMKPYVLLIISGAILVCLSGKWLFPSVFGNDFSSMHLLMVWLMPGYVCLGILTLINAVYLGKGDVDTIFKGDLFAMILLLLVQFLVVPTYGATAAAITSSCCYLMLCLYLWINLKKHFIK